MGNPAPGGERTVREMELSDGDFYVCSGVRKYPYDVAQWGGDRLGIEFADYKEAKRLAELLQNGEAELLNNR